MNVLKDKQTRTYENLNRYAEIPFYYNTLDNKYVSGVVKQLSSNSEYTTHKVKPSDTLDSLALYYYGRPDYYWVISDFNRIIDVYKNLYDNYETIKIPSLSYIYFVQSIHD